MDATHRFVRDQNLDRFAGQLMVEPALAKRETLRKLLIAEEDRFGSLTERLDKAEKLIVETEARMLVLERLVVQGEPAKAAFHKDVLASHKAALGIFADYARTLREAADRSSP